MLRAVTSRRLEFATARACARRALQALGREAGPILRGSQREPLWPAGIVGSITHCTGYRAAAVAETQHVLTIGIDAEVHASIPPRVLQRVALPQERAWLAGAPGPWHWDRLLFCAKECVYKAWFPLTRSRLGFEDALITFEPLEGIFHASIRPGALPPGVQAPVSFTGRYAVRDGLVLTAIAVLNARNPPATAQKAIRIPP